MRLFFLTILIIFYIVISNFLTFDRRIINLIESTRYSSYMIVFFLALTTLYIQDDTLDYITYILSAIGVVLFFYVTPFIKLEP